MKTEYFDERKAKESLPPRPKNANKGTFGKVLIAAGSPAYPGAACLSAEAALRSGVGYVIFSAAPEVKAAVLSRFPEIVYRGAGKEDEKELAALSSQTDATLFGPGCGNDEKTKSAVIELLKTTGSPLILDADALSAITGEAVPLLSGASRPVVITPHPGEFSRLSGLPVKTIEADRVGAAVSFAKSARCVVLLKGNGTVVTDGDRTFLNTTGDTSLAKAGSGDVLAGLIAGLCASGVEPQIAAALGAYLHGKAGETLGKVFSPYGVTASDLPAAIAKEILALTTE